VYANKIPKFPPDLEIPILKFAHHLQRIGDDPSVGEMGRWGDEGMREVGKIRESLIPDPRSLISDP
jgi:hypothetical protein